VRAILLLGLLGAFLAACGDASPVAPASTPLATTTPASATTTLTTTPVPRLSPLPTATNTPIAPESLYTRAILVSKQAEPPHSPTHFCIRYSNPRTGQQDESCKTVPAPGATTPSAAQDQSFDELVDCWALLEPGQVIPPCWR
jgi:hypothetical protein